MRRAAIKIGKRYNEHGGTPNSILEVGLVPDGSGRYGFLVVVKGFLDGGVSG